MIDTSKSDDQEEGLSLFKDPPANAEQCALLDAADKAGFTTDKWRLSTLIFKGSENVTNEVYSQI
jgi:hypothetical protein